MIETLEQLRRQMVMALLVVAVLGVLGGLMWLEMGWRVKDAVAYEEPVLLPSDAELRPGVADLAAAVEALASRGGPLVSSPGETLDLLRQTYLAGGRTFQVLPPYGGATVTEWVKPDSPGWGSGGATHRAVDALNPKWRVMAVQGKVDGAQLVRRLGRPTGRQRESAYEFRGGPILPGGPEFTPRREVKVGEYDLLTYGPAGLHLKLFNGDLLELHIDLSALPDLPSPQAAVAGPWSVDREHYRRLVEGLLTTAPDERWRAEYAAMSESAGDFELTLDVRPDGTGRAEWKDLTWMSHPHGFRVGWERGASGAAEFRWVLAPGGIMLTMPVEGGGARVVGFSFLDDALWITTRHPRELKLSKPGG